MGIVDIIYPLVKLIPISATLFLAISEHIYVSGLHTDILVWIELLGLYKLLKVLAEFPL
jgi:hypothetical protein